MIGDQVPCQLVLTLPDDFPELMQALCSIEGNPKHWLICGKTTVLLSVWLLYANMIEKGREFTCG